MLTTAKAVSGQSEPHGAVHKEPARLVLPATKTDSGKSESPGQETKSDQATAREPPTHPPGMEGTSQAGPIH